MKKEKEAHDKKAYIRRRMLEMVKGVLFVDFNYRCR